MASRCLHFAWKLEYSAINREKRADMFSNVKSEKEELIDSFKSPKISYSEPETLLWFSYNEHTYSRGKKDTLTIKEVLLKWGNFERAKAIFKMLQVP